MHHQNEGALDKAGDNLSIPHFAFAHPVHTEANRGPRTELQNVTDMADISV